MQLALRKSLSDSQQFTVTKNGLRSIYNEVARSVLYVPHRGRQFVKTAQAVKRIGHGNCIDVTILLSYLLINKGYPVNWVFVEDDRGVLRHVYLRSGDNVLDLCFAIQHGLENGFDMETDKGKKREVYIYG